MRAKIHYDGIEGVETLLDVVGATGRSPLQIRDVFQYVNRIPKALRAAHSGRMKQEYLNEKRQPS
jgi:hypothetical protein